VTDPERAAPSPAPAGDTPAAEPLQAETPVGATEPSILDAALKGLCPRCGQPTLFCKPITFAARCSHCGLDFSSFNVGDGPAAFLTLIIGTIVIALVIWLQLALSPPWWVHLILWPPVTIAMVMGSLRLAKGALIAAEYRNAAREGRIK
jgi:uncharacterized protein (DUF983 family)